MHAAAAGEQSCLSALLDAGAQSTLRDALGRDALLHAATKGHAGCVEQLIAAGSRCDACHIDGHNALHAAARSGSTDCVELLLGKAGAEPFVYDSTGKTAADYAREAGFSPSVDSSGHLHPNSSRIQTMFVHVWNTCRTASFHCMLPFPTVRWEYEHETVGTL